MPKNILDGLTVIQAKEKLKEFGLNEIKEKNKVSPLQILFRQVKKNFVVYLLALTAIASFAIDKGFTGWVVLIVIALVVITGFIQEYKAEKAISALKKLIMPVSRVIRDGREKEIPSSEIVPGDIVVLRTGDKIPADCVVVRESSLSVNESILTGESSDIRKIRATDLEKELLDENLLFMGSYVVSGRAFARVLHTGMNTKFGEIAGMISGAEKHLPLQDKINNISKYMVVVSMTAAVLTGVILFLRADAITPDVLVGIFIIIIALAVSSFPEGFPVVLTTTLAAGVSRMSKQNAVVNRMSIIETLGETSVICSDKTGTLTKGEMTVETLFADGKTYHVSGVGYDIQGNITGNGKKISLAWENALSMILKTAVICNDSNIEREGEDGEYKVIGSSTEGALLVLAAKLDIFRENYLKSRIEEIPFDSKRKMMSVLYPEKDTNLLYVKGAIEVVLPKCTHILINGKREKLTDKKRKEQVAANQKFSAKALRTLSFAYKENKSKSYTEDDLTFLGIAGMEDSPREEVAEAIELCRASGIKVKMITGDNKETAEAIARQIGIVGKTVTGYELDEMTDSELSKIVNEIGVFARVKPEDKLRIIKALKENDEIVTMTGDGVNDAPALKEAHIGVAMGINGTDVSRSVADITLKDDNFATIVLAIKEGRTIFNNIRKFVTYQLACNFSDIYIIFMGMLVAPFLGWYTPVVTALQILFMNIVTDNIPALTLGFNPSSKDIMKERPRKNAKILTNEFINIIILNGSIMGIVAFVVAYLSFNIIKFPPETARTTVLLSMILVQIANAYTFRSFRHQVFGSSIFVNKYLVFASLTSVLASILIIYTPLNKVFETVPLGIESWLLAFGAVFVVTGFFDIFKAYNNKNQFFLHHVH